jgi:hypothetical protein
MMGVGPTTQDNDDGRRPLDLGKQRRAFALFRQEAVPPLGVVRRQLLGLHT